MEIPNCATIKVLRRILLPPVNVNPFFRTPITCVPDKTNAGYKPAKKLTSMANSINATTGMGCSNASAVNCFPVISLKYGISKLLKPNASTAAMDVNANDSPINCINT